MTSGGPLVVVAEVSLMGRSRETGASGNPSMRGFGLSFRMRKRLKKDAKFRN